MGKSKRPRTIRRELSRRAGKAGDAADRLFAAGPGGSPERPITVETPAVIETRARGTACPRCAGEHELREHLAVTVEGVRLRETRLLCRGCRTQRSLWFRLPVVN